MVNSLNTRSSSARKNAKFIFLALTLVIFSILLLSFTAFQKYTFKQNIDKCSGYGGLPSHAFMAQTASEEEALSYCSNEIPLVSINVKNRHFITLQKKRLEAKKSWVLITSDEDLIPAHITIKDKTVKAQIRLKGDWMDHVHAPTRWSFRVQLSGDDHILGRRRFSLQSFLVRGYDVDPLYSKQLRHLGLMPLQYSPVRVQFNGEDWGVMLIEDHFTKELMEFNKRKESVVGRFDEADMWIHRNINSDMGPYDNVFTTVYKPYNRKATKKSAQLHFLDQMSRSMMAAWQEERLPLADIVDLRMFARFIITSEGWGSWHPIRWHNQRFYLNPYTLLFEPIPYDNTELLPSIIGKKSSAPSTQMIKDLFDSKEFMQILEEETRLVSSELTTQDNMHKLRAYADKLRTLILAEGGKSQANLDALTENFQHLSAVNLDFYREFTPIPRFGKIKVAKEQRYHSMVKVTAYDNGLIALVNQLAFDILVTDIELISRSSYDGIFPSKLEHAFPITLKGTALFKRPEVHWVKNQTFDTNTNIEVTAVNPTTKQTSIASTDSVLYYLDEASYKNTSPIHKVSSNMPEFAVKKGNHWQIPKGEWRLPNPLIVPKNIVLDIEAGAHLIMHEDTYILARNAIQLNGTKSNPITISGEDGQRWRGIYILNSNNKSRWSHTKLQDLKPFATGKLELSGAINVYSSEISMSHVSITNIQSEDVINLVKSRFQFDHLSINGTTSDAIDSDYSTGLITNSTFTNIGGDGIDTSGSQIEANNIELYSIADKAISIGEASSASLHNLTIKQCGVGVAVKDYSTAFIDGISITEASLAGLMAYIKKPEYGGAKIEAFNLGGDDSSGKILNQTGSLISVDNVVIQAQRINIKYLYNQGFMPK